MNEVIAILKSLGWEPHGHTDSETVRVPTSRAPVFGGIGGELRTFGGRLRFSQPGTNRRCTVGPRKVCVYEVDGREATAFRTFRTSDLDGIRAALDKPTE